MGFLTGFKNDVFISYAHIDNRPLSEGEKGWIDNFHLSLERRVAQLLGADLCVWRDPKLKCNDYFDDVIRDQLKEIALLVSVFSPRYVESDSCREELVAFSRCAESTGGIRMGNKCRILKVVKTPVDRNKLEDLLPLLGQTLSYDFYRIDGSGCPREFKQDIGNGKDQAYWDKLEDLAYDICKTMKIIEEPDIPAIGRERTVFLAETTSDLAIERDKIRRELQQRGYRVLPDHPFPLNAAEFNYQVREQLIASRLSIHLLGAYYGIVPEGETTSVIQQQIESAALLNSENFQCLLWLPESLEVKEQRQRDYLVTLQSDSELLKRAEFLQTSLEGLKTTIIDILNKPLVVEQAHSPETKPPSVYLICDSKDFDSTDALQQYLFDRGFEVMLPAFEGDEEEVREAHRTNLLLCDGVLIYYGQASDAWVSIKKADLQKIPGYGRTDPLKAKAVFIADPETKVKQRLQSRDLTLIHGLGAFNPEVLSDFIKIMSPAGTDGRRP